MIKRFLKGLVVGVAKVMPGVSGSVLAISLGIYYKCVLILSEFYKLKKQDFIYIFPIVAGVLVGILAFSTVIESVYQNFYLATMLLFIGFIICDFYKDFYVNLKKDLKIYIIGFFIITALLFIDIHINFDNKLFLFFFLGMIESFTMVIPGISGTAILISLDFYDDYLNFITSITQMNYWFSNLPLILVYTLSLIICGYLTIKLVSHLVQKVSFFDSIVRFLMLVAIISMGKKTFSMIYNFRDVISCVIFIFIGFIISNLLKRVLSKNIRNI